MVKFVVVVETNDSWEASDIKDNIEEAIPGWKVQVLSFVPESRERSLLLEIISLQEEGRSRLR